MQVARNLAAADAPDVVSAACTVAQWLRHWLTILQPVRERTRQGYADHVPIHLIPGLGRVRLTAPSPIDLRHFFASRVVIHILAHLLSLVVGSLHKGSQECPAGT